MPVAEPEPNEYLCQRCYVLAIRGKHTCAPVGKELALWLDERPRKLWETKP